MPHSAASDLGPHWSQNHILTLAAREGLMQQGLKVPTSKRVTFDIKTSDSSLGKASPKSSDTDVDVPKEETRKHTTQRTVTHTETSSANHLPPVHNGAVKKSSELAPALASKPEATVSRRGSRRLSTQALGIPRTASPVMVKTVTSIHRRWSTEPTGTIGKMTQWETMDMLARDEAAKEKERTMIKLEEIQGRVEKALEVVGMSSPREGDIVAGAAAPSWGKLVNELHAEFAASYEETYHQRDHIRGTIITFEETIDICHESMDALEDFFNRNLDLRDELVSQDKLDHMIQSTEGLAEEVCANLQHVIGSGDKLMNTGSSLLSAATHILTVHSKATDVDKWAVTDAKSLTLDPSKWNTSVRGVKKVYDDGVRRAKKAHIRNLLKFNQRQYNQLMKVADSRHEMFTERQRQLSDIDFRHTNGTRALNRLQKELEELNWTLDHSKTETAEWQQVVFNLNKQNDKLIETIKSLRAKIKRLESLIDKEKQRAEALRSLQDALAMPDADADSVHANDPVYKLEMELRADQNNLKRLTDMQEELASLIATEQVRTDQLEQMRDKILGGSRPREGSMGSPGGKKSKTKDKSKKKRRKGKMDGTENGGTQDIEGVSQSSGSSESGGIQSTTSEADTGSSERQERRLSKVESDMSSELCSEETTTTMSPLLSEDDMVRIQGSVISLVQGLIHFHAHLQACMGSKGEGIKEGEVLDKLTQAANDMMMVKPRVVIERVLGVIVKYLRKMEKIVIAFYRSYTDEGMASVEEIVSPIADLHKRARARGPAGTKSKQKSGPRQQPVKPPPVTKAVKEAPHTRAMKGAPGTKPAGQAPPAVPAVMKDQSPPQYEDVGAPEAYRPPDFTLPNILNKMERMDLRAQEEEAAEYHRRMFKSEYSPPEQVMAAARMNVETEEMFKHRQARLGPVKIQWAALQENLRLLNEAMENNKITEDLYVEATTLILKALEMPDRKLRIFLHRYLAYKRCLEIENNIINILDDEEEGLTEAIEISLGMYLEESKDRLRTMTKRWKTTQDAVEAESVQLNKDLYNVMCRVYTQHGLLLSHPLLKYPARAGLVLAPHVVATSKLVAAQRMIAATQLGISMGDTSQLGTWPHKPHLRPLLMRRALAQQRTNLYKEQGVGKGAVLFGSSLKRAPPSDYWSHAKCLRLEEKQDEESFEDEEEKEKTTLLPRIHVPHVLSYDINKHHIQANRNMRMKTRKMNAVLA